MKRKKRTLWGVVMILAAAGLLCMAVFPEVKLPADLPVWKVILGVLLVLACGNRIFFAKRLAERFDCIFLLALLFLLFEREIGLALGKGEDFVHNGLVIAAALLLTCGIHALLDKGRVIGFEYHSDKEEQVDTSGSDYRSRLSSNTVYFDLSEKQSFTAENKLGELEVRFQNTDWGEKDTPVLLTLHNELGQVDVYVPENWEIECRVENSLGACNVGRGNQQKERKLIVYGSNRLGEVEIKQ